MRVFDPTGRAADLIRKRYPDAEIGSTPERHAYDAAVVTGLEHADAPAAPIFHAAEAVKPGGRVIVVAREGAHGGAHALRSLDVAALMQRHGRLQTFAVTDDSQITASMIPCERRGQVAVWTGQALGPWMPSDIAERGLGGSETAAYRLSEELAGMGYVVTLYGDFQQEGMAGDVLCRDFRKFDPTRRLDVLVGFRDARLFDHRPNADTTILWLEDLAPAEALTPERAANIDRVCGVSRWHKGQTLEVHPWLDDRHVAACRNGIHHPWFEEGEAPERELRVLYTSSPDRGLDVLLNLWPEVRRRVPGATLVSTYSRWFDEAANQWQQAAELRTRIREQLDATEGASRIQGGLGQRDLAHLMRSSTVWAHPSFFSGGDMPFHETSCISAMESQAAGLVVVASNWGALTETVAHGTLVDGDPRDPAGEWRRRFVDAIVEGLTSTDVQRAAQDLGPEMMRHMDWRGAAEQLVSYFERPALVPVEAVA